jgi:predicted CoA-binding protein
MGEGSLLAWGTDMAFSDVFERESGMGRVLSSTEDARRALRSAKRLAVLGIKPETHAGEAAHYVPAFMQRQGCEIVPVPVYYPDVTEILGQPVYRKLVDVPGDVDMVIVFRRNRDVLPHVDDIIAKGTKTVWMQLGIENAEAAERLTAAGIDVVQNRCAMVEWR